MIALVGVIASSGLIIALMVIHYRQHSLQQKIASAQLSQKMLEYWKYDKHQDFVITMEGIKKRRGGDVPESDLDYFLPIWDEVAMHCNERTITKTHARMFFLPDLKITCANKSVQEYMKKNKAKYPHFWKMMQEYELVKPA